MNKNPKKKPSLKKIQNKFDQLSGNRSFITFKTARRIYFLNKNNILLLTETNRPFEEDYQK